MQENLQKLAIGFLFDDTLDSDAGVSQYVKTLGAWLSSQGHSVSYLVGETKLKKWAGGNVFSLSRNLPVSFNGNRLSIPLPASSANIKRVLDDHKFDVLHVQVPHSPMMSQRVLNKVSDKTAVVGTFHILPAGRLAKIGSSLLRVAYFGGLSRFDTVLSVSQPAADFAYKYYGVESTVIPNVVDIIKFTPTAPIPPKTVDIVFLGRLVPRKGCRELLEAFVLLHQRRPQSRLVIAGDGPSRQELEKFVKQNHLSEVVEFRGYISEDEKPALLASAKIACFPALSGESFGIVLIEAMAAGSGVVIGGDNPGYSSVLQPQPELIIDPTKPVTFARKLELLLNDTNLRSRLHRWQAEYVARFDVSTVGPQIVKVYRDSILNRSRNSDSIES